MRCILGIGNPGSNYINTRHNIGFQLIDGFASKLNLNFIPSKSEYYFSEGKIGENHFCLVKPTTFVNNSGVAALSCTQYFGILSQDLLVVVDDVNIKFGEIRLRKSGGDGGHNGLRSIIYHLNSEDFPRLRFGIGEDFEKGNLSEYVLSKFTKEENEALENISLTTYTLLNSFITGGYDYMLSEFSRLKNLELKENKTSKTNESQE